MTTMTTPLPAAVADVYDEAMASVFYSWLRPAAIVANKTPSPSLALAAFAELLAQVHHLVSAWLWALHESGEVRPNREPSITAFVDLGDYIFGDKDGRDGIALLTGCAGQQVDKTLTEAAFKETVGAYLDNEECLPLDKLDEMRLVLDDAELLTELYDEWKRDYC